MISSEVILRFFFKFKSVYCPTGGDTIYRALAKSLGIVQITLKFDLDSQTRSTCQIHFPDRFLKYRFHSMYFHHITSDP